MRSLDEAETFTVEREEIMERGLSEDDLGEGFQTYLALVRFWRPRDLKDLVRTAYPDARARVGLTPWIAEGVALTETAIWATSRSLRDEPETREVAGLLLAGLHKYARPYLHSHLTVTDPDVLFAGMRDDPVGAYVEASWLDQLRRAAHVARLEGWSHEERIQALLRRALEGDPSSPLVRLRQEKARDRLD